MAGQPLRLTLGLAWYLTKNKLRRRQRFPLTIADPGLAGQGPSTASQAAWALSGLLAPSGGEW
jgi:hypothetical protein